MGYRDNALRHLARANSASVRVSEQGTVRIASNSLRTGK
jgi:hypothetical protein